MSEITKLYENAGIKKLLYCDICKAQEHALGLCSETKCEPFYPPFTAEKQLKLIKWFMHSGHFCPIRFYVPWLVDDIASHINFLWQNLTEEEKQQVKGDFEMSEITKLYENAGVLKECLSPCYINKTWRKTHDCPNCDNREYYPPFTAEKQIELIKWLGKNKQGLGINYYGEWSVGVKFEWEFYKYSKENEKFTEALAGLINKLWQELTEKEKQQIKEILR